MDAALALRAMQSLPEVCDDRGLLVITHDAAALEGFDRVLRLQHGSIASHDARDLRSRSPEAPTTGGRRRWA